MTASAPDSASAVCASVSSRTSPFTTTGTETAGGYTEAGFNFNVATYLRADLIKDGARVVMTRKNNHGIGPCVNRRARISDGGREGIRGLHREARTEQRVVERDVADRHSAWRCVRDGLAEPEVLEEIAGVGLGHGSSACGLSPAHHSSTARAGCTSAATNSVMAGLDPAIHVFIATAERRGCPAQGRA